MTKFTLHLNYNTCPTDPHLICKRLVNSFSARQSDAGRETSELNDQYQLRAGSFAAASLLLLEPRMSSLPVRNKKGFGIADSFPPRNLPPAALCPTNGTATQPFPKQKLQNHLFPPTSAPHLQWVLSTIPPAVYWSGPHSSPGAALVETLLLFHLASVETPLTHLPSQCLSPFFRDTVSRGSTLKHRKQSVPEERQMGLWALWWKCYCKTNISTAPKRSTALVNNCKIKV